MLTPFITFSFLVKMGNYLLLSIIFSLLLNLSLACPSFPNPTPKSPPPPKARPPPPPPKAKPCPPPPSPPPKPKPCPPPPPTTPTSHCPIDTLKLSACVDTLRGLVHGVIGDGATHACCLVLTDLTDLNAAFCLCTTIKAKVLDVKVILPIALELLVDCGKHPASGYQCPA